MNGSHESSFWNVFFLNLYPVSLNFPALISIDYRKISFSLVLIPFSLRKSILVSMILKYADLYYSQSVISYGVAHGGSVGRHCSFYLSHSGSNGSILRFDSMHFSISYITKACLFLEISLFFTPWRIISGLLTQYIFLLLFFVMNL